MRKEGGGRDGEGRARADQDHRFGVIDHQNYLQLIDPDRSMVKVLIFVFLQSK